MLISQKCQYALRALFELARRRGQGPVKISEIAEAQVIPARFLEAILGQLKQGGFVESRRGNEGGYLFLGDPSRVTVGDLIRFVQGPVGPVACVTGTARQGCPLHGDCVFFPMWRKVQDAMEAVYDHTSFQDLLDEDARRGQSEVLSFSI